MRTYIWTETASPERGMDARITVWRIKRNRPHYVGYSDSNTASWNGDETEARHIIVAQDGGKFATKRDGSTDRYQLHGEVGPAHKYRSTGHPHDAVRLFGM